MIYTKDAWIQHLELITRNNLTRHALMYNKLFDPDTQIFY